MSNQPQEIINEVFKTLKAIFPASKSSLDGQESIVKRQWMLAFQESETNTLEKIKLGFSVARQSESPFMPSCGQFISWCRPTPEQLGLLEVRQAYKSLFNGVAEPDAITRAARKEIGSFEVRTWSESKLYPIFEKVYSRLVIEAVKKPEALQIAREQKALTHG